MKEILETEETVILVDAKYLDEVGRQARDYFSHVVKRSLPKADLPAWAESVALDAGLRPGKHRVQVIFIYPREMKRFTCFEPDDLSEDLHGVAFRSNLGEFSFSSYSTEALATHESMFADFSQALSVSKGTVRLVLVGDLSAYGDEAVRALREAKEREVCLFSFDPQDAGRYPFAHCNLGFPLLHALGVRPDELE